MYTKKSVWKERYDQSSSCLFVFNIMCDIVVTERPLRFIRNLEVAGKPLKFHQDFEGDVNCVVWDASIVLAKYLEKQWSVNNNFIKGLKIVELGAGVGCAGIVAATLGGHVTLTDLPDMIPLLNDNAEENRRELIEHQGSLRVTPLKWGDINLEQFPEKPDMILVSDCIYYENSIEALVETMVAMSKPETTILVSQEVRVTNLQLSNWHLFRNKVDEYFYTTTIKRHEQDLQYAAPEIKILRLKLKPPEEQGTRTVDANMSNAAN